MEQKYFTTVPVPRAIIKFAVPTILSQLITLIYNLADTFFVGHTGDPNQVAALTLCFPIFMLMTLVGNLTGIGANSLISRSMGREDKLTAARASAFGFYGAILLMLILIAVLRSCMTPILTAIGASEQTLGFADSYLTWTVVIGGLPTIVQLMMGHLLRAEGNTRHAGIGMGLGGILNILLDPVFVFALDMGVAGAGMATALSNTVSMGYMLLVLYCSRGSTVLTLSPKYLGWYPKIMKEVILVGLPAAMVILLGSSANMVLTRCMSAYGDTAVAAFGVVQKIGTVTIQITIGLTQGIMPLIGFNYAAGNGARTRSIIRCSFLVLAVYTLCCMGVIELMPGQLMRAFIPEAQTVALGATFMRRWILCAPGMCLVMLFNSVFQAMGKWLQSTVLSMLRQGILLIPLLLILNRFMGMYGLVWSQPLADTAALILGVVIYIRLMHSEEGKMLRG